MILLLTDTFREHDDGSLKLFCQTQDSIDIRSLSKLVPLDQDYLFRARWGQTTNGAKALIFERVLAAAPAPPAGGADPTLPDRTALGNLSPAELETLAAERGIPWDPAASPETMVERVLAAAPAPSADPAATPPAAK